MKFLLTCLFTLFITTSYSQTYENLMEEAFSNIQNKNYKSAYSIFVKAFNDNSEVGMYDLTSAAFVATQISEFNIAIDWLDLSIKKGLGKRQEELDYILKDTSFRSLYKFKKWKKIKKEVNKNYNKELKRLKKDSIEWIEDLSNNRLMTRNHLKLNPGFALYFQKYAETDVPYLVYIPKKHLLKKNNNIIVFLHGGVANTSDFNYKDPRVKNEPIFNVADSLGLIVIYPFGKKSFGWVDQPEAFENILNIINEVKEIYDLKNNNTYLGGMSNGGTATFWFASQKPNIFNGFFAISAFPHLSFDNIKFENISQGKPFYSLNDKNDQIYSFDDVEAIYNRERKKATDWKLEAISGSGHGFIYDPNNGPNLLINLINNLIDK